MAGIRGFAPPPLGLIKLPRLFEPGPEVVLGAVVARLRGYAQPLLCLLGLTFLFEQDPMILYPVSMVLIVVSIVISYFFSPRKVSYA